MAIARFGLSRSPPLTSIATGQLKRVQGLTTTLPSASAPGRRFRARKSAELANQAKSSFLAAQVMICDSLYKH
jgi:hypothetical protein